RLIDSRMQCHYLPIEEMTQIHLHRFALRMQIMKNLEVSRYSFIQCILGDRHQLDRLYPIVEEVPVEFSCDLLPLLQCLLRQSVRKIIHHHLFPVAKQIINYEEAKVGQSIKDEEGQQRDEIKNAKNQVIHCTQR